MTKKVVRIQERILVAIRYVKVKNMIYDCFFSYQNKDLHLVESIADELEKRGLSCWYAPRNISGRYAKAIAEGISHSRVFIIILNDRSAVSEAVLNEVEMAHNISKNSGFAIIQPLCTKQIDLNAPEFQEMMYYIRRLQFLNIEDSDEYANIADMIIKSQPQLLKKSQERKKSQYVVQTIEDQRLKTQNELLKDFDNDVYTAVFSKYDCPRVLDVGCGTGDMLVPLAKHFSTSVFVGIDRSNKQIEVAKEKYKFPNFCFDVNDVTSQSFEDDLIHLMNHLKIDKFDIINISMLLLHLKEPIDLLSTLKNHLSVNGTLVIRDIDDGLNFAFPDPDNLFERIYKMCEHDEQSGNRRNGRQIYHDLIRAGFSNIQLNHQGLSSVSMNSNQKEALFQMYFPFTLENARIMMEKYPWNVEYKEDYLWYKSHYESIHRLFSEPEFVFSLGFVSFTAQI